MDYKICNRCIMDTSDEYIQFDSNGNCNHCDRYFDVAAENLFDASIAEQKLNDLVAQMKRDGKGKEYDCIFGVSGGVDSTFVAYQLNRLGLRGLAVHMDNGWNSELSVKNIENTLNKLNIDLFTYVLDWEEFKDLQLSFLKSSTPDSEIPTDYAITALMRKMAIKFNTKYIITGSNVATEAIMPVNWSRGHRDRRYVKGIQKIFGSKKLKTYPHFGLFKLLYYTYFKKQQIVKLLNFIDYNKDEAMRIIQTELDWKYYGGKHYESIYTRFYQGFILPEKFGYDKRRAHMSTLICSKQISREDALLEIQKKPYPSENMLADDKEYLMKKFNLTKSEFDEIMNSPARNYSDYPNYSNYFWYKLFAKVYKNLLRRSIVKKMNV